MYVTLRMTNNKKITARDENIILFTKWVGLQIPDGKIAVNVNHVLYARPAKDDEIEHARIHGW